MKRKIVKFYFHNSVHFGSDIQGVGQESAKPILHSDTLFSAICNVWAQVDWYLQSQGALPFKEALNQFRNGNPPFKLSSGFPFQENTFYLPKPENEPEYLYSKAFPKYKFSKHVKQMHYLRVPEFAKWLEDNPKDMGFAKDIAEYEMKCFIEDIQPKASVNRRDGQANIYHSGNYFFNQQKPSGLYAIVELNAMITEAHFEFVLQHLGKFGLGGNRNIGFGAIKSVPTLQDLPDGFDDLFNSDKLKNYSLLSLYFPQNSQIVGKTAVAYQLVLRKGWIGSNSVNKSHKKKTCYMFSEGSVFSKMDSGCLLDVKPDQFHEHDVWRNGYAMTIPVLKEDSHSG